MTPDRESKATRKSVPGETSPPADLRLWWPFPRVPPPMESELQRLREENERLQKRLDDGRAALARITLAWERESQRSLRNEAGLLASYHDFVDWFDSAAFPMTCVGSDGLIEQANSLQLKLLGYSRAEYVGRHMREFVVEDEVVDDLLTAMGRGRALALRNFQARMICRDGGTKPVLISAGPFSQGIVQGICCYVHDLSDITEVRTEKKINEYLFRQLAENIREVFWMTSADKKEMLYVSPVYEAVWGRSCESLYRNPASFLDGIVEEDRQRVLENLPLQSKEGGYVQEYRVRRPDGAIRWVRDRAFPVKDEAGTVYRIAGLAEDITKIKESEAQQRHREFQQKALTTISRFALREQSVHRVFEKAVGVLATTLGVELTQILRHNPDEKDFLLCAGVGWKPGLVGAAVMPGGEASQPGFTLLYRAPVVVEDFNRETRFEAPQLLADHGVVSSMSVVIEGRTRPFGILGVNTRKLRRFSEDEQKFLQAMANILAAANDRREAEIGQQELSIELARERQRLDDLLANIPAIVWELRYDPGSGELQQDYVSDYAETMLGYSAKEFISRPTLWQERIFHEDRHVLEQEIREVLSGGQPEAKEIRWIARDGRLVWVASTKRVFYDEAGKPAGLRGVALDITERKLEEERRREAEERFNDMLQDIPGIVWELRINPASGELTPAFVSGYVETLLGYPREHWLKDFHFWLERIHPDDRERTRERVEALLMGEDLPVEPFRCVARDGHILWTESRTRAVRSQSGQIVGLRGVITDISAQKQAEEERRKAEERIRNILTNVPGVVWEMRLDPITGNLGAVFVSDYIEIMSGGYTKEEFLSDRDFWLRHVHPEDRNILKQRMAGFLHGRGTGPHVARWLRKDGQWIWIESSLQVVQDETGKAVGLRGVTVDVTTRKQAEAEREAAEVRFRAFMDHSPVVALMKDEEGRYIWGNQRFIEWCEKLGFDWFGHTDWDLFPEDLARRYRAFDVEALEKPGTHQVQEVTYDKFGTPFYWIVLRFAVDIAGRRMLGTVALDITEQRRLERDILEISDREQRRLGQELHDGLCQHILGIALMSKTLADRMKANDRPEAGDVQGISDFLYESLNIVRGVMEGFNLVNLNTNGGLAGALEAFAITTSKLFGKKCRFRPTIHVDVPDVDVAGHIFRIAQEATHNALKHAHPTEVVISIDREGSDLVLKVENDGQAMPEPMPGSKGVGIRTMKYRADLIGASLRFEKRSGGGTVVICRIPAEHGFQFSEES